MHPPLCVGEVVWCLLEPPRGVPIPPRPSQNRRDSSVSAAVWGWVVWCLLKTPHGASLSPRGPGRTGGARVHSPLWRWVVWCLFKTTAGRPYPPAAQAGPEGLRCIRRCGGVGGVRSPQNSHGASLSPRGPARTGGTRVYPPLCGGGWCGLSSKPPRGVPIPARPRQDLGDSCVSAAVWRWVVWCLFKTPAGRPYPPRPRQDRGDSCVSAVVWRRPVWCLLKTPARRPYPPRPSPDRGDSCVSAVVWRRLVWWLFKTPARRPYPPAAQAGPEGLVCIRRCVEVGGVVPLQNPDWASLSPRSPGGTGGTKVYPALWGGRWCVVSSKPPRGVPIPPQPSQDGRDSGVSAAVWGWVVWCLLKTPTGRPYPPAAHAGPKGLGCIRRRVRVGT